MKKSTLKKPSLLVGIVVVLFTILTFETALTPKISAQDPGASLTFSETEKTVNIGEEFSVDLYLDTGGANIDAVDVIINYPQDLLEVVEVSPNPNLTYFKTFPPLVESFPGATQFEWNNEIHYIQNDSTSPDIYGSEPGADYWEKAKSYCLNTFAGGGWRLCSGKTPDGSGPYTFPQYNPESEYAVGCNLAGAPNDDAAVWLKEEYSPAMAWHCWGWGACDNFAPVSKSRGPGKPPINARCCLTLSPSSCFTTTEQSVHDGKIIFGALTYDCVSQTVLSPHQGVLGSGNPLATITFKAKSVGTETISFDFQSGETTDTNVVEHGTAKDILSSVNRLSVNIVVAETICDNQLDDDNDRLVDCADPDCGGGITSQECGSLGYHYLQYGIGSPSYCDEFYERHYGVPLQVYECVNNPQSGYGGVCCYTQCYSACRDLGYEMGSCAPCPSSGSCFGTKCRYDVNSIGTGYEPCDSDDCCCYNMESCGSTQDECNDLCDPISGCPSAYDCCNFDFDNDGKITIADIMIVVARWGAEAEQGDPDYDPKYDINGDGEIDVRDIMLVAVCWQTFCEEILRVPTLPPEVDLNLDGVINRFDFQKAKEIIPLE